VRGESHVETEKIDELAGGIDLRLESGLALTEHGGAVERHPPRSREQIGGAKKDARAVREG
jgi:hypothetical protein